MRVTVHDRVVQRIRKQRQQIPSPSRGITHYTSLPDQQLDTLVLYGRGDFRAHA
jgi:hypothetical protein